MALQYNVSSLLKEPVGSTRIYEVDDRVLVDEEGPVLRHVRGHVRLLRTNDGILVEAKLAGADNDRCSRCLRELDIPMEISFEEMFYPQSDILTGARATAPLDPEAFRISDRWILDLDEPIRQFWTVALPMQALCRADCRGLCPQCGKDWNEGSCQCAPQQDERWNALKALQRERS